MDIQQLKTSIRRDALDRYNLTDLWKLAGSTPNRNPNDWKRTDEAKAFLLAAGRFLNTVSNRILESKKGRSGGTWGHEQVFIEYAQYLDARLAVLVNQAFIERLEEETSPELAVKRGNERASNVYKKRGHSESWIAQRIISITTRKAFTFTLANSGVKKEGFRNCTNAIYAPLYGGTSAVVRMKKGLSKNQSIRDNMSMIELSAIMLSESLAAEQIEVGNLRGNAQCELACNRASRAVAHSIIVSRQKQI